MHKGVKASLAKIVVSHIKNIYKQLFLPDRSLHKLPAIMQQLLSDPGFGHIHIISQPSAICKNCKIATSLSLTAHSF